MMKRQVLYVRYHTIHMNLNAVNFRWRSEAEETTSVHPNTERQIDTRSDQIHGLVVTDMDGPWAIADHVSEENRSRPIVWFR